MQKFHSPVAVLSFLALCGITHADELRVDLNQANGRKAALSLHRTNWDIANGQSATQNFGDVSVTLSNPNGGTIESKIYKGLLDFDVRLGSDAVVPVGPSNELEMTISGLAAGTHTLTTYHNELQKTDPQPFDILVENKVAASGIVATKMAQDDEALASAFITFDVAPNQKQVSIRFRSQGAGSVILNGFDIDAPNSKLQASHPLPDWDEEHADATQPLKWQSPAGANQHLVFFGTNADAVEKATSKSPEFKGKVEKSEYALPKLDHQTNYFWRVDEVVNGQTIKGDVWRFRPRFLAFKTAEGYGRFAIGGRGGRVIEVTNLEDYGQGETPIAGSYRAAIEAEGPRTVIFRVSGIIRLKRPCTIFNPYITVAGQTAPGDGICIANYPSGAYSSHDAIIRFMRFRVGDFAQKGVDGAGLGNCDNAIMDHSSISWASDEGTSSRGAKNISFQRNIVAESLQHSYHYNAKDRTKFETHAFAGSISGNVGSYHHNLLAHCTDRNWSLAGGYNQSVMYDGFLDIRNNVVYNWTARTTDGGVMKLNYVNNYYKPYAPNKPVNWLLKLDPIGLDHGTPQYYMNGNVMEGFDYEKDNWKAFNPTNNPPTIQDVVRSDKELYPSYVTTQSAGDAFKSVLADVGATFPKQDAIDRRIIEETRTGTVHYTGSKGKTWTPPSKNFPGIIDTQDDVKDADGSPNAPWPEYKTYNVPVDTDHDGMPDDWEIKRKLNPKDATDGNADRDKDGFTNLEEYLGWLVGEFPNSK